MNDPDLLPPTPDLDESLRTLRARLADEARSDGLLDVVYRTLETPIGRLTIAATPAGVVRLALPGMSPDAVLDDLAGTISPRILHAPAPLDPVVRQIDEYFAGTRRTFEVQLDMSLSRGFRRAVLEELRLVPYGHTASYAELAAEAGNPRAVRAAGSACATNPIPIIIPCHRIIRSDGSLGNYGGGVPTKVALLRLEGAIHDEPELPGIRPR